MNLVLHVDVVGPVDHDLADSAVGAKSHATEIRVRAARKAGELLKVMAETGERVTVGQNVGNRMSNAPTSLSALGVTRDQSSRWQAIYKVDEEEFEARRPAGPGGT